MTKLDRIEAQMDIQKAVVTLLNAVKHAPDQVLLDQILSGIRKVSRQAQDARFDLGARSRDFSLEKPSQIAYLSC